MILKLAAYYLMLKLALCSGVCPVVFTGKVSYFGIGEKGSNKITYFGYDIKRDNLKNFCAVMFDKKDSQKYRDRKIVLYNPKNEKMSICKIIDRGPSKRTGRVLDLSKDVFDELGLRTDDIIKYSIME